jgi:hypothetical protein
MLKLTILSTLATLLLASTTSCTSVTPPPHLPTTSPISTNSQAPSKISILDDLTELRIELLVFLEHQKPFLGSCNVFVQMRSELVNDEEGFAADWKKWVNKCERMAHLGEMAGMVEKDLEEMSRYEWEVIGEKEKDEL